MPARVLHIIDGLGIGGAERVVFELASRLRQSEFSSEVIGLSSAGGTETFDALSKAGIPVRIIEKRGKLGLGLLDELTEYLSQNPPEIVHTHLFAADLWGALAADRAGVPVLLSTEHSVNRNEGWLKHRLKCWTHHKRDTVVAISETVATYTRDFCPSTKDKVRVISNGIDLDRFLAAKPQARRKKIPTILVVGRLETEKGQLDLLNALPLVTSPFRLQLVGKGTQEPVLRRRIAELMLSDRVELLGPRQDVEKLYHGADIVVVPSRWEGLGLAAIEAMASGCAVLASDVDGLRELVRHEETGLLADFQAPGRVAAALMRLMEDAKLRQRLGAASNTMVRQTYDVDTMLKSYCKLYNELLATEIPTK